MENLKVVKVTEESIIFDNGVKLYSQHEQDCCEHHYLDFRDLTLKDFEGQLFSFDENLDNIVGVKGYGIRLISNEGIAHPIPGYGINNGYYSDNLEVCVFHYENDIFYSKDISECQSWSESY